MAQDKQYDLDYLILGVVGFVAVIAIMAMAATTTNSNSIEELPPVFTDDVQNTVGAAVVQQVPQRNPLLFSHEGKWDYDGDGALTEEDSILLARAIDEGRCFSGMDCDHDNNGILDNRDLGVFNSIVLDELRNPPAERAAPQQDRVARVAAALA